MTYGLVMIGIIELDASASAAPTSQAVVIA